jgi:hypothetical protein
MLHYKLFNPRLSLALLAVSTGSAQFVAYPDEQPTIANGSAPNTLDVSWFGHSGRAYFIKQSSALETGVWSFLPVVEKGTNSTLSYLFSAPGTGGRFFARTEIVPSSTSYPNNEDADGDKISNMDEIQAGLDPLTAVDSDSDGMKDDWERFYFGDLSRDGTEDFDGDGTIDSAEYTAGSHPNTSIQYGTLKFRYASDAPTTNAVYMTDFSNENSLTVTYTDATHSRVSSIAVHLNVNWTDLGYYGGSPPVMASYAITTDTAGAHTLAFTSLDIMFNSKAYKGMDILRAIDEMPYARITAGDAVKRVCSYMAITSSSIAGMSLKSFPAIIRDFPYGSPDFLDFGRGNNNNGGEDGFVNLMLDADGLPKSALTDSDMYRKIYSAGSFDTWYRKADTLSINMGQSTDLDGDMTHGFRMYEQYPFTVLTSSAGGNFNQFCWTSEVHARLAYDVSSTSSHPTKIRVSSDDDVFVFINGRRIIEKPGIPGGYQELILRDADHGLPLETGTCDVAIFHAERREYNAAIHFQTNTALTPVYAYQVIADHRFSSTPRHFDLSDGKPPGMSIDANTGKVLWDYSGASLGTYTYTVNVVDGKQNTDSQTVNVVLGEEPIFTTTLTNQSVVHGGSITLSPVAAGTPTPTFQWYKENTLIPGATSLSYTITNAQYSDTATYKVRATNPIGTATTSVYVLVYEE